MIGRENKFERSLQGRSLSSAIAAKGWELVKFGSLDPREASLERILLAGLTDIANEITAEWKKAFGDAAPIGFDCRTVLHERWLRVHSLPESQRYPGTTEDVQEILRRHNQVATELLGANEPCMAFVGRFVDDDEDTDPVAVVGADLDFVRLPMLTAVRYPNERMHFAAARTTWAPGLFDETIVAVAQMEEANVLFANFARGCAYARYDGGADLILLNNEAREAARARWSAWLSSHPSSL